MNTMLSMVRMIAVVIALAPLALPAQNAVINDYETHFIRGLAQRQQAQMGYDKLAVEKASSDAVKALAQRMLDAHAEGEASIEKIGRSLNAWGANGVGPGDVMGRRGGGAPGPGGPAGGRAGGGPPGANVSPPGGSYDDELNRLTGPAFDRAYLLLSVLQKEEMLRALALEIETPTSNAQLVSWSKQHVEPFRALARALQKAARGEGDAVDNPLERERGTADGPPRAAGTPRT